MSAPEEFDPVAASREARRSNWNADGSARRILSEPDDGDQADKGDGEREGGDGDA